MSSHNETTEYKNESAVKNAVFDRIEREHVTPRTKTWFQCREAFFWTLIVFVMLLGAFAIAETYFRVLFIGFDYYEVTHGTLSAYILDVLPLIWITVLVLALLIGHYNIRHTKKGYRYPLSFIMLVSILGSVLLGAALYRVGLAHIMDARVAAFMPFQKPVLAVQERLWSEPEKGRLVGTIESFDFLTDTATVTSPSGAVLNINTSELVGVDRRLIAEGETVRFVGIPDDDGVFRACHAMQWHKTVSDRTYADVKKTRLAFRERIEGDRGNNGNQLAQGDAPDELERKAPQAERLMGDDEEMSTESMAMSAEPVDEGVPEGAGGGADSVSAMNAEMSMEMTDEMTMEMDAPETNYEEVDTFAYDESNEVRVRSTFCGGVRPTAGELKRVIEERGGLPLPLR